MAISLLQSAARLATPRPTRRQSLAIAASTGSPSTIASGALGCGEVREVYRDAAVTHPPELSFGRRELEFSEATRMSQVVSVPRPPPEAKS